MRPYWRHLLAVEVRVTCPQENKMILTRFMRKMQNLSDKETEDLINKRSLLKAKFKEFKESFIAEEVEA